MPSVEDLARATESELSFLAERGYLLAKKEIVWPASFKGGFVLRFENHPKSVRVQYLDMEVEIRIDDALVFGHEHLVKDLVNG